MRTTVVVAAAAWLLSGCATLDQQIDKGVRQAQELADRCERLEREQPVAFDALLSRVEARFHLACSADSASCPFGVGEQVASLRTELARTAGAAQRVAPKFDALDESLRGFDRATGTFVATLRGDQGVDNLRALWKEASAQCGVAGKPADCNQQVVRVVQALQRHLARLDEGATGLRTAFGAVTRDWDAVLAEVGELGGQLPATRQRLALEIGNVLDATRRSLEAIARASTPEFRQVFFDRLLPTHTAERVLDFTERQFEPLDRLVERADDRFYMLGSVAIEWHRPDLQTAFDNFYKQYVRKEFRSTSSARAFARAACARLSKPTAQGRAASIITPFLYSSMTLIEDEVRVQEGGEPVSRPRSALLPVTHTIFDDPQVYNQCLAAERRIHQQLGSIGQRSSSEAVRDGSQKACGEALLESEQRTEPLPGAPRVATASRSRELAILPAKVEAQVDRLSLATLEFQAQASPTARVDPPPPPPPRVQPRAFCSRVVPALAGASCVEDDAGAWIEFNQAFATGRTEAPRLVPALRMLGRLLQADGRIARMEVQGLASRAPMSCRQWRAAQRDGDPCAAWQLPSGCADPNGKATTAGALSANQLLARARACWTADVVRNNAPSLAAIAVRGATSSQAGNPDFDRMVSIRVEWGRDPVVSIEGTKP